MSDHNEHACSECGSLLHYAEHCPRLNPTTPAPTEQLAPTPSEFPIALTFRQEADIKLWAADDQLWTTQETVAFNLRTLARKLVATERAAREAADTFREELRGKFHHLSDLKNEWQFRAETAEARLATVGEVLTNRYNEGRNLMNCGAETLACITQIQEYISSTTPPPILKELERLREENRKLRSGWQRIGDQFKAGNGPRECFRFQESCEKNKGQVVETVLSCIFSLWNDLSTAESKLQIAEQELERQKEWFNEFQTVQDFIGTEAWGNHIGDKPSAALIGAVKDLRNQLQIAREALECAGYALEHPDSDQWFAKRATEAALAKITDGPLPSDSSASRKEK